MPNAQRTSPAAGAPGEDASSPRAHRGAFLTIEGGDGAGKTTQADRLASRLEREGYAVCRVHEPGGTALGERIRSVLLDSASDEVGDLSELLLYEAARAQVVEEVIRPALARGEVVVCDRFDDSTTAYQGYGRGLDAKLVQRLNAVATGGLSPDRTVLLSIDPSAGMERAMARSGAPDRMEGAGASFHERVHEGFRRIAEDEPERVKAVDASKGPDEVEAQVFAAVEDVLASVPRREGGAA